MASLHERIAAQFANGTGPDSSAGGWNPGAIGPVDILASRLVEILRADANLAAIFKTPDGDAGDSIERWDFFPVHDYADLPKLYVYPTSADGLASPTQILTDRARLFLGIRFPWGLPEDSRSVDLYTAGLSTLVTYLRVILHEDADPICATVSGTEFLVGHSIQVDGVQLIPEQLRDGTLVATLEIAASWKQDIDLDTGRLEDQPASP